MISSAASVIRRMPKRLISAAANGAISPNSTKRMPSAEGISAVSHPNSRSNGSISTPGAPTVPAVTSMVRNVTPAITQP